MIELRWVTRDVELSRYGGSILFKKEKFLQSRYMQNISEIGLHEPLWSEWKDVPVAEE